MHTPLCGVACQVSTADHWADVMLGVSAEKPWATVFFIAFMVLCNIILPSLYIVAVLDTYEMHTIDDLSMIRASQLILDYTQAWKEVVVSNPACTMSKMPISNFLLMVIEQSPPIGFGGLAVTDRQLLELSQTLDLPLHRSPQGSVSALSGHKWTVDFEDSILAIAKGILDIDVSQSGTVSETDTMLHEYMATRIIIGQLKAKAKRRQDDQEEAHRMGEAIPQRLGGKHQLAKRVEAAHRIQGFWRRQAYRLHHKGKFEAAVRLQTFSPMRRASLRSQKRGGAQDSRIRLEPMGFARLNTKVAARVPKPSSQMGTQISSSTTKPAAPVGAGPANSQSTAQAAGTTGEGEGAV